MAYTPPTLLTLRTSVRADLSDDDGQVFGTKVDSFINEAVAELNRIRPIEQTQSIPLDTGGPYDLTLSGVFRVEFSDTDVEYTFAIPMTDPSLNMRSGWDEFARKLYLGDSWYIRLHDQYPNGTLEVFGYGDRDALTGDADVAGVQSLAEEFALRRYARLAGLRLLVADRSLFQQWQGQANNTDVSPTQLVTMTAQAEAEWDRTRRRMWLPRRSPEGNGD